MPGELAVRFEAADLRELLGVGISIEEGTQGILIQYGKFQGFLEPGYHSLASFPQRLMTSLHLDKPCEVVLVDIGSIELPVSVASLSTRDNEVLQASLSVVMALESPGEFYVHLMRGKHQLHADDVVAKLQSTIEAVMQAALVQITADELYGNMGIIDKVSHDLEASLRPTSRRLGLKYDRCESVTFSGDGFGEIQGLRGDVLRDEARFGVRRQQDDLDLQKTRHAFDRETQYRHFEQKFRELYNEDRSHEVRTKEDFEQFVKRVEQEAKVQGLHRQGELDELSQQFSAKKEDFELSRRHLLEVVKLQREREKVTAWADYRREKIQAEQGLDEAQRAHQSKMLESDLAARLNGLEKEHDARLSREKKDWQFDHETIAAEAELAMRLQQQYADNKLHQERGRMQLQQDEANADLERRVEELKLYSELSAEALIAAVPEDRARLLAELKQTEAMRGMSERQIMAMAREKTPEIGRALEEMFKADGNREHYEQLLKSYEDWASRLENANRANADQVAQLHNEHVRMMKEVLQTSLSTQRDVSVAAACGPQPPVPAVSISNVDTSGGAKKASETDNH